MILWGLLDSVFSTVVSMLFLLTIIFMIVLIIMDNRNPYKTLAWVLVLVFLPVIGLIAYFFFGRDTRKERLISKKGFARLTKYPMMEFQLQYSLLVLTLVLTLQRFSERVLCQ